MEKPDRIPDSMHSKFATASITSKTDAFCQRYLNDEYRQLVRTAVAALCRKRPSPLLRGSEDFWAAGFIHAIGTANFVFDTSQTPHCNAPDIYSFVSLDRVSPSKFESNPLIWMLTVNGMMVDVRHLPIEVQEVAYQKALLTTDIQALVLGIRKECSCCKMAAGYTTVGSTPYKSCNPMRNLMLLSLRSCFFALLTRMGGSVFFG